MRLIVNKINFLLLISYFIVKIFDNPILENNLNLAFLVFLLIECYFLYKDKKRAIKDELILLNGPETQLFGKIKPFLMMLPFLGLGYHIWKSDVLAVWPEVLLDFLLPFYFAIFGTQLMAKKIDKDYFYFGQLIEKKIALNKINEVEFEQQKNVLTLKLESGNIQVRPFFSNNLKSLHDWTSKHAIPIKYQLI